MSKNTSIEERIALLLRKAESTDSEHERDALMEAAEKMMIKYGIEMAQLDLDPKHKSTDEVVLSKFVRTGIYAKMEMAIIGSASRILGVRTFYNKYRTTFTVTLIDFESTYRMHQRFILSLLEQGQTAMRTWWTTLGCTMYEQREGFVARRSFLEAFAVSALDRLEASRKDALDEVSGAGELVLARSQKIDEEYNAFNVAPGRQGKTRSYAAAVAYGLAAGEDANISMIAGDVTE